MKKNLKFTLIELLVVVAIIAVLASMLLPALAKARDKTRSIVCLNNLKQMGLTMSFYAEDHRGLLPCLNLTNADEFWTRGYFHYLQPGKPVTGGGQASTTPGLPDIWKCPSMDLIHALASKTEFSGGWLSMNNVVTQSATLASVSDWYGYGINDWNRVIAMDDSASRQWTRLDATYPSETVHMADFHHSTLLRSKSTPATFIPGQRGGLRHSGGKNWLYFDGHASWLHLGSVPNDTTSHFWADSKYE